MVAPVPVVPSPKSHAYEAIVPSESVEALPSTATVRFVAVAVNAAVGATFAGSGSGCGSGSGAGVPRFFSVKSSKLARLVPVPLPDR